MSAPQVVREVDPFDLPEWLGTGEVTWSSASRIGAGPLVAGELTGEAGDGPLPCDLLAGDRAHPVPMLDEGRRRRMHQEWSNGQVVLLDREGRLTLAVPGTCFSADLVLEALGRLAKALGIRPERVVAALRL